MGTGTELGTLSTTTRQGSTLRMEATETDRCPARWGGSASVPRIGEVLKSRLNMFQETSGLVDDVHWSATTFNPPPLYSEWEMLPGKPGCCKPKFVPQQENVC